jgi:hypothetical protein
MNIKLILIAAAACGLAAQGSGPKIQAPVPFAFEANGVKMPAGRYEVTRSDRSSYLLLRNAVSGNTVALPAGAKSDNKSGWGAIEFRHYKGVYFLSALEYRGAKLKYSGTSSRREKEMAIAIRPEVVIAQAE